MSEPATFSIEMKIEGMKISASSGTLGDRSLRFEAPFPADDTDLANEIWYKHLALLFGDNNLAAMKEASRAILSK